MSDRLRKRPLFSPHYWKYWLRYAWFRLRNRHIRTNGFVFLGRGARIFCRRGLGYLEIGRWVWIGDGCRIRCHEGSLRIGDKVVFGTDDVVNCYLDVRIGAETLFADQTYVSDFDHRYADPDMPIRKQGIVKTPTRIGRDCWIGEKVSVLRATDLGDGSVAGAQAVLRGAYPPRSVVVGAPGRIVKRRGNARRIG